MPQKFADVPETWRYPAGPCRQAPKEFGGEWWQTDFTTGPEPWKIVPVKTNFPDGFLETFLARPTMADYRNVPNPRAAFLATVTRWDQDLKFFVRAGWPPDFDYSENAIDAAKQTFQFWAMGEPRPYQGRYGYMVRYPESKIRDYESGVREAIEVPHLVIARYQARLIDDYGIVSDPRHPWVPAHLWPADNA